MDKRIEKFTESSQEELLRSNPESESYVVEELNKLQDKWQLFKNQVLQKRQSLNHAIDFFEIVEKVNTYLNSSIIKNISNNFIKFVIKNKINLFVYFSD